MDISGDQRSASVAAAAYVSWNTFSLVGHRPEMGRDFTAADDRSGAPPVVVISGTLWRVRYGADPAIVGRTVRVNGIPSTIVGVMPQDVGFPYRAEIWVPLAALPDTERTSRATRILDGFGRLRGDATIEQATTELSGITASLAERYPDTNRKTAPFVGRFALGVCPSNRGDGHIPSCCAPNESVARVRRWPHWYLTRAQARRP